MKLSKRIKSGLAVTEKHIALCDGNLRRAGAQSRNEFVEMAIEFYTGYLGAATNPEFYERIFTSESVKKVEKLSKTLGTGQFKIAVELAKLCVLMAQTLNLSRTDLEHIHNACVAEVKSLNGVPTFQQITRDIYF